MTPSALERLEAELQDSLEDATLAIYADQLQTLGDPRGELIALDLRDAGPEAAERRGELLRACLAGDGVDCWLDPANGVWYAGDREHTWATFHRGFLEVVHVGETEPQTRALIQLLDGRSGRYLNRLTINSTPDGVRAVVEALANVPRLWLDALALGVDQETAPFIDQALHDRLRAATPRLELLDVVAPRMFHVLAHPTVREISVLGHRAIGLPDGPAMPNVRVLEIAFDPRDPPRRRTLAQLITPSRFPQLRQLRLGRCEPGSRFAFPLLDEIAVAPQLTHLRLPSLRSPEDRAHVQAAIDRVPDLRAIEIVRAYSCFGHIANELRHAARIEIAPLRPWAPLDHIGAHRALAIGVVSVSIAILIQAMELCYADLPARAQDDWDQFWRAVANDLGWRERGSRNGIWFSRAVLARALDGLGSDDEDLVLARQHLAKLERARHVAVEVGWR